MMKQDGNVVVICVDSEQRDISLRKVLFVLREWIFGRTSVAAKFPAL
jgi:hypothetical protein